MTKNAQTTASKDSGQAHTRRLRDTLSLSNLEIVLRINMHKFQ